LTNGIYSIKVVATDGIQRSLRFVIQSSLVLNSKKKAALIEAAFFLLESITMIRWTPRPGELQDFQEDL
ncbi:MAG: hypothetical protein ACKOKF_07280, partial [Bacteroidota bacterium]